MGERKGRGQTWAEIIRGYRGLNPHKLQPVGEILTESVTQPFSILCTENHNFKISTSEIRMHQVSTKMHLFGE